MVTMAVNQSNVKGYYIVAIYELALYREDFPSPLRLAYLGEEILQICLFSP